MRITYTRALFSTYTFDPKNYTRSELWLSSRACLNRSHQKLCRRLGVNVDYLACLEQHKSGFPHAHKLLIFPFPITVERDKYVDGSIRTAIKRSWSHGFVDVQAPRVQNRNSVIHYVLKYLQKSTSSKHLWKLILGDAIFDIPMGHGDIEYPTAWASYHTLLVKDQEFLLYCTLKEHRIKLLTWSRNFVASYRALYSET